MNRLPDWNARLHEYVDAVKRSPFDWCAHNCATFVAGAVEAMTGENIAKGYRFRTERGALAAMRRAGFDNLADMAASRLAEIPEGPCRAGLGDVAAIPTNTPFGFVLGIVNGEMILALRPDGMGLAPLLSATRAFRI